MCLPLPSRMHSFRDPSPAHGPVPSPRPPGTILSILLPVSSCMHMPSPSCMLSGPLFYKLPVHATYTLVAAEVRRGGQGAAEASRPPLAGAQRAAAGCCITPRHVYCFGGCVMSLTLKPQQSTRPHQPSCRTGATAPVSGAFRWRSPSAFSCCTVSSHPGASVVCAGRSRQAQGRAASRSLARSSCPLQAL